VKLASLVHNRVSISEVIADRCLLGDNRFLVVLTQILAAQTSEPNASTLAIGNGQACLGDNSVNDFFAATLVQRVQSIAPTRDFATQELRLAPYAVFFELGMKTLQKNCALHYQPIYSFCILHEMHECCP
jgi:hypothetical protein